MSSNDYVGILFIFPGMMVVEAQSHSVALANLELIAILLPQPSESWDYRHSHNISHKGKFNHCQKQVHSTFSLSFHGLEWVGNVG